MMGRILISLYVLYLRTFKVHTFHYIHGDMIQCNFRLIFATELFFHINTINITYRRNIKVGNMKFMHII